uniref:VWFA domain-containing protein n=1 Tax=Strongyloides venezuelensis TaxID=75913 RepID=A0A0K0FCN8_STRVS
MISKNTSIFLIFLQIILTINGKNLPLNEKIYSDKIQFNASCSNYYGLFLIDNTNLGNKMLSMQLTIVDYFFDFASSSNYWASATVTSQSTTSVTNNFSVVSPNDYASLNKQFNQVLQQIAGGTNISYFDLIVQALQLNLVDSSVYSYNPVLIFFVDSPIVDLNSTSQILENLNIKNKNKVKFLAIAMDPQNLEEAGKLVGGANNVYTFNSSDENNYNNINNWILQQSCSSSLKPTTTTTVKPPCDSYVNIVIDASSDGLTQQQFNLQIDLIENYILPMWSNFSKISTMIMYNDTEILFREYNNYETLDYIRSFINNSGQSKSNTTFLHGAMYILDETQSYLQHKTQMSTFVFLASVSEFEIAQAAQDANNLAYFGKLNIVTMGNNIENTALAPLQFSNLINWDYSNGEIRLIQEFVRNNLVCF